MNPPFRLLAEIGQRQGSPAAAAIYVGRSKPIGPEDGDAYSSSTKEAIEHIVDSQPLHFVDC